MSMTVSEMHDIFEQLIEDGKGDTEVMILHQPSWPFYLSIKGVGMKVEDEEEEEEDDEDDNEFEEAKRCKKQKCYQEFERKILIVENGQEGYGCSFDDVEYF